MNNLGRRRTERILAPVRIRIIGNDMSGVTFAEETVTVTFNQQGARISLVHSLLPGDIVHVKNLENSMEEEFRVVGAFVKVFGNRREWGVELLNQESGIWGVEFRSVDDNVQPKVLVECAACETAAQNTLSSIEYDVLLATGAISRHCARCNETTRWKPSAQTVTHEILVRLQKSSGQLPQRIPRLRLTMQLRVRNALGVVDIAKTRDVSKTGLSFVSSQPFSVGDETFITLPSVNNQTSVETRGRIIWLEQSAAGRLYGVEYVG